MSRYYLWILREQTAVPSDILDYLKYITNLKGRSLIDSKLCSAGVQCLRAASWLWPGRDHRRFVSDPLIPATLVFQCELSFLKMWDSSFTTPQASFWKSFPHKSPCQKYATVWICNSTDTKETMTRAISFEAFRVLFLEIHFGVCTTFHIKALRLRLCTVTLCCRCVAMLRNRGGRWEQGSSSTDKRVVGKEMLSWGCCVQHGGKFGGWWGCCMCLDGLSSLWTKSKR